MVAIIEPVRQATAAESFTHEIAFDNRVQHGGQSLNVAVSQSGDNRHGYNSDQPIVTGPDERMTVQITSPDGTVFYVLDEPTQTWHITGAESPYVIDLLTLFHPEAGDLLDSRIMGEEILEGVRTQGVEGHAAETPGRGGPRRHGRRLSRLARMTVDSPRAGGRSTLPIPTVLAPVAQAQSA